MKVAPVTLDESRETAAVEQPVQVASNSKEFDELVAFFADKKGLLGETATGTTAYTVQRGDNLWQICRNQMAAAGNKNPSTSEVNAAVQRVAQASGLKDANILTVGQKLDVSTLSGASKPVSSKSILDALRVASPVPPLVPSAEPSPSPTATVTSAATQTKSAKTTEPVAAKVVAKAETRVATAATDIKAAIAARIDPAFLRRREELLKSRLSAVATDGAASLKATGAKSTDKTTPASSLAAARGVDVEGLVRRAGNGGFLRRGSALGQGGSSELAIQSAATKGKTADITMMIQSILEPGSVTLPDDSKGTSAWSELLEGGGHLSSGYGMRKDPFTGDPQFHFGVDVAADTGTKIFPYESGTVKFSGWLPGTGKTVVVQHRDGLETVYGHASETLVTRGQAVTADTTIAEVGSTGRSTGPHLHFEVRKNGRPIDPMPLLTGSDSLHVAKAL